MVKQQNEILATAFADLGWEKYAERSPLCLNWLEWLECIADPYHPRKLSSAHFCKIRMCPCCQKRRSFKAGETMLAVAEETLVRQPTLKFLFLTLTVPNISLDKLSETLTHITQSWNRLMNRKKVKRIIKGYHRAIEITHNADRGDYHPHMHIILAVNSRYFKSEDYINHEDWLKMWQQSTRQPEITQVDIRTIREGGKFNLRLESAVSEACKYSLKTFNFKRYRTGSQKGKIINLQHRKMYKQLIQNKAQISYGFPEHIFIRDTREETALAVQGLSNAIHGKKFTHFGGIFKDIKNDLKLQDGEEIDDLLHTEESSDCVCPVCKSERKKSLFKYCQQIDGFVVQEYLRTI
ncbi:MAG: protein rep [Waterburya sp.]